MTLQKAAETLGVNLETISFALLEQVRDEKLTALKSQRDSARSPELQKKFENKIADLNEAYSLVRDLPMQGTVHRPEPSVTATPSGSRDWQGKTIQMRWELGPVLASGSNARIYEATDRMSHEKKAVMVWEKTDDTLYRRLMLWKQHAQGALCQISDLLIEDNRACAVLGVSVTGMVASPEQSLSDSSLSLIGKSLRDALERAGKNGLLEGEWSLKRIWIDRDEPFWLPDALEPVACSIPVPAETPVEKAAVGCAYALYSLALGKEPGFGAIPFVPLRPSVDRSVSAWCDGMLFRREELLRRPSQPIKTEKVSTATHESGIPNVTIFRSRPFHLALIVPVLLWGTIATLWKPEKVIFPMSALERDTYYDLTTFSDSVDGGASSVTSVSISDTAISYESTIRSNIEYPYAGLSFEFLRATDTARHLNLRGYTHMHADIAFSSASNQLLGLRCEIPNFTRPTDYYSYAPFQKDTVVTGEHFNGLIPLKLFTIPDWWWWYSQNKLSKEEVADVNIFNIRSIDIQCGEKTPLDIPVKVTIRKLSFVQDHHPFLIAGVAGTLLWLLLLCSIAVVATFFKNLPKVKKRCSTIYSLEW